MKIVFPNDWANISSCVQLIIHTPGLVKEFDVLIYRHTDEGSYEALPSFEILINKSRTLNFSILTISTSLPSGKYGAHFFDKKLRIETAAIGFTVNPRITFYDLRNELNEIESLFYSNQHRRFLSNGMGKSGTSWLLNIFGAVPGINIYLQDSELNVNDHANLIAMPCGHVYHGHFKFGSTIDRLLKNHEFSVVNIARDLRDVAVSEYFHKFHFQKGLHRPDIENLPMNILLSWELIKSWSTAIYLSYDSILWDKFYNSSFCLYEDLITSPRSKIESIFLNIGLVVPPNLLNYIIEVCDFVILSEGRSRGDSDPNSFFRTGLANDWRRFLSDETSNSIVDHFEYFYDHFGYSKE